MRVKLACFTARLILASLLWLAWFVWPGAAKADCFDCLVSIQSREIWTCQPAGHLWGKSERLPIYRVERICGLNSAGAGLLSAPLTDEKGQILTGHRFESDGRGGLYDRKTAKPVSVAEGLPAAAADQSALAAADQSALAAKTAPGGGK